MKDEQAGGVAVRELALALRGCPDGAGAEQAWRGPRAAVIAAMEPAR